MLVLVGVSCSSKKSDSASVDFQVLPGTPQVITGNYTYGDNKTATAPWFQFKVQVTNNSTQEFTMIGLQLTVTAFSKEGVSIVKTGTFSPADSNQTISCGAAAGSSTAVTWNAKYTDFGTWLPGESKNVYVQYRCVGGLDNNPASSTFGQCKDLIGLPSPCNIQDKTTYDVNFFFSSAPDPVKDDALGYTYSVVAKPFGWFGPPSQAAARFERTFSFGTN